MITTVKTEPKETLESVSASIKSKRKPKLDNRHYPLGKLKLAKDDIRESRDKEKLEKLGKNLVRDGQLQPITISIDKNGRATITNGRTRYIAMNYVNEQYDTKDFFKFVKVEVYEDLTLMEQDYLNAQINVSQNPLTKREVINFVRKYRDILDPKALGDAVGLQVAMVEKYVTMSKQDQEVLDAFATTEGYDRGDTKAEEGANTINAYEKKSKKPISTESGVALGNTLSKTGFTRDIQRKFARNLGDLAGDYENDVDMIKKYSPTERVEIAAEELKLKMNGGGSGDVLPEKSEAKYPIIDKLLKDKKYNFCVSLFTEGLYRKDQDGKLFDSETKRILDNINDVVIVGNDMRKLNEVENYGNDRDILIDKQFGDVIKILETLADDDRCGFIYVNGAALYAQRPDFINYLKKKYPNSTVAIVMIDLLFGKSQVYGIERSKELMTVYGGAENIDELLAEYRRRVPNLEIEEYADYPQMKYIMYC